MVLAMWFVWAGISSVFFGLMVYRGTLKMHEGTGLALAEVTAKSYTHAVNKAVVKLQNRVQPALHVFAGATAALSLALVGSYVYTAAEIIRARMH